jgi:hypothetical protein
VVAAIKQINLHAFIRHAAFATLGENASLKLYDLTGRVMKEIKLSKGASSIELSSAELASGIYQLQLQSASGQKQLN